MLRGDKSFPFPLTQETTADVVGLSVVHVNRTLQQMRREGRITLARGLLALLDKEALAKAGEFVPPALSESGSPGDRLGIRTPEPSTREQPHDLALV